jgi:hypothetical protein
MFVAHILGIPVEETAIQLASAGATLVTVIAIAGRTKFGRVQRRFHRGARKARVSE